MPNRLVPNLLGTFSVSSDSQSSVRRVGLNYGGSIMSVPTVSVAMRPTKEQLRELELRGFRVHVPRNNKRKTQIRITRGKRHNRVDEILEAFALLGIQVCRPRQA